jgi:hypothetical protein
MKRWLAAPPPAAGRIRDRHGHGALAVTSVALSPPTGSWCARRTGRHVASAGHIRERHAPGALAVTSVALSPPTGSGCARRTGRHVASAGRDSQRTIDEALAGGAATPGRSHP